MKEYWSKVMMKSINDDSTVGVDLVRKVMFFTFCAVDIQWCLTLGASYSSLTSPVAFLWSHPELPCCTFITFAVHNATVYSRRIPFVSFTSSCEQILHPVFLKNRIIFGWPNGNTIFHSTSTRSWQSRF